jgi:hypothetical protein
VLDLLHEVDKSLLDLAVTSKEANITDRKSTSWAELETRSIPLLMIGGTEEVESPRLIYGSRAYVGACCRVA